MKYKKGYKYQLVEDFSVLTNIMPDADIKTEEIDLSAQGLITIRKGYAWDGASGFTLDTLNTMTPSLVHDAMAQLMRQEKLAQKWRKQTNQDFHKMLIVRSMYRIRAWLWKKALDKCGKFSTAPENMKIIHDAP